MGRGECRANQAAADLFRSSSTRPGTGTSGGVEMAGSSVEGCPRTLQSGRSSEAPEAAGRALESLRASLPTRRSATAGVVRDATVAVCSASRRPRPPTNRRRRRPTSRRPRHAPGGCRHDRAGWGHQGWRTGLARRRRRGKASARLLQARARRVAAGLTEIPGVQRSDGPPERPTPADLRLNQLLKRRDGFTASGHDAAAVEGVRDALRDRQQMAARGRK